MNKKSIIQYTAVFFLIAGLVLIFPNTNWQESVSIYGFISVVLGTFGSIISIFIPSVFVMQFDHETWNKGKDDYFITIPSKKHGMGRSPQMQTFLFRNNEYEEVMLDQRSDSNGKVTIRAINNFTGKIIIK
jgi:hypothetical protein